MRTTTIRAAIAAALTIAASAVLPSFATGEYDEIYTNAWPVGATLASQLPATTYVTDGLVGHFDGISNAGTDQPHDSTTRTWKNLVAGGPDAEFWQGTATTTDGSWNESGTGFYFNYNAYARLASEVSLGTTPTVQLVTDIVCTNQKFADNYTTFFHGADSSVRYTLYITGAGSGSDKDKMILKADGYANNSSGSRPSLDSWEGKYLTSMCGSSKNYLFQGVSKGSGKNRDKTAALPSLRYTWGGIYNNTKRGVIGTYYAVRMYDRNLTDAEIAWNYGLDEIRFRGLVTNGTVIVATSIVGAEGTEASGQYYVNGHHEFTASATTIGGQKYRPTGYTLEIYNPSSKTWVSDGAGEHAGNSFAYTNCAANTGARISWQWEVSVDAWPSGATLVNQLPATAYVTNGLVGHFDGISNAGTDQPHNSSATTWVNLGSGGSANDATLTTLSANVPSGAANGAWTDTGYYFKGQQYFDIGGEITLGKAATVQLATEWTKSIGDVSGVSWPLMFGGSSADSDNFGIWHDKNSFVNTLLKVLNSQNRAVSSNWDGLSLNAVYDGANSRGSISKNTAYSWQTMPNGAISSANTKYVIGTAGLNTTYKGVRMFNGIIKAVRIYDRVLSEKELAWNQDLDEIRFRGLVTNGTVVVATSIAGAEGTEASGQYYVNGHHEFTASATTIGGQKYRPTGYTLEIYNPSSRTWVSDGAGEHAENSFAYTNCAANTGARITWQWEVSVDAWPEGATLVGQLPATAYVTNGLVGHFDGISNAGTDQPHDSTTRTWKNLVSGGPDADFRNNTSVSASGSWNDTGTGFHFSGDVYAQTTGNITFGSTPTVQLVTDVDCNSQKNQTYVNFFYCKSGSNTVSPFITETSDKDKMILKTDTFANNNGNDRLTLDYWKGEYLTFMCGSSKNYMFQGADKGSGATRNKTADFPVVKYSWGGIPSDDTRYVIGTYYAVRMYNRELTDAEIAWNYGLDEIRFRGLVTNGTVVVATNVEGAEGDQASGQYYVNGHATFTAPATATVNGLTYILLGYTIEHYNPATKEWDHVDISTGNSFDYANRVSDTGVRITWQWSVSPAVTIPVGATLLSRLYVTDNLVGHFDGIRNAGFDSPHSSTNRTWKNLVAGGPDADFRNGTAISANGSWDDTGTGFYFSGDVYAQTTGNITFGSTPTVQLVMDVDCNGQNSQTYVNFFYGKDGSGNTLTPFITETSDKDKMILKTDKYANNNSSDRLTLDSWKGKYLTFMCGSSKNYMFQDADKGSGATRNETVAFPVVKYSWGGVPSSNNQFVKGTYYAVRMYSDNLTDEEIAWNRYLDEIRFRGADVTRDIVIVKSSIEGVDGEEISGTYYVNGNYTFNASATTNVNGRSYVLTGYTLDIYDPSTKEWASDGVELHEGTSFSYTNCLANTGARITWQWIDPASKAGALTELSAFGQRVSATASVERLGLGDTYPTFEWWVEGGNTTNTIAFAAIPSNDTAETHEYSTTFDVGRVWGQTVHCRFAVSNVYTSATGETCTLFDKSEERTVVIVPVARAGVMLIVK